MICWNSTTWCWTSGDLRFCQGHPQNQSPGWLLSLSCWPHFHHCMQCCHVVIALSWTRWLGVWSVYGGVPMASRAAVGRYPMENVLLSSAWVWSGLLLWVMWQSHELPCCIHLSRCQGPLHHVMCVTCGYAVAAMTRLIISTLQGCYSGNSSVSPHQPRSNTVMMLEFRDTKKTLWSVS